MTKQKLLKLKLSASKWIILALAVTIVGIAAYQANAFRSESENQKVVVIEGDYIEAEAPAPISEPSFGAVTSPYLNGPDFAVGLDDRFSVSRELADATNTFAFATPFLTATSSASDVVVQDIGRFGLTGATTTVEMVRLKMTSSTPTAYEIGCGGAATKYATSTLSYAILTSDSVIANAKGVIENNVATGAGAQFGGGAVAKIHIGPTTPYIVCRVYSATLGEFTNADGVSPGNIAIRFSRVR